MPAIPYGYLPVLTKAARFSDKLNFATSIATQGAYAQSGTAVTDFVAYEEVFVDASSVTGVSVRLTTVGAGTKPTISAFSVNAQTGTITSLVTPFLDTAGLGDHEISVPFAAPVKLGAGDKLTVFIGGKDTAAGTIVKGVLISYVPGP